MPTLLVLGSKPGPVLPPAGSFHAVACANASGYSADRLGLPVPVLTAISAVVTSGIGSGRQSLKALRGLRTEALYRVPQLDKPRKLRKRLKSLPVSIRTSSLCFRSSLRRASYRWNTFVDRDPAYYRQMIATLCRDDPEIKALVARKKPSTGVIALMLGMSLGSYDRFILSGFSFELTHAYANNPEIRERGTTLSRHTATDVRVLRRLVAVHGNIFTTEPAVHAQAGIPFLPTLPADGGTR